MKDFMQWRVVYSFTNENRNEHVLQSVLRYISVTFTENKNGKVREKKNTDIPD